MYFYSNFNAVWDSTQNQDISVFNIKISPGTIRCAKEYNDWIKTVGADKIEEDEYFDENMKYVDRVAYCLANDRYLPENMKQYLCTNVEDNTAADFYDDSMEIIGNGFENYYPVSLYETFMQIITDDKSEGSELSEDFDPLS